MSAQAAAPPVAVVERQNDGEALRGSGRKPGLLAQLRGRTVPQLVQHLSDVARSIRQNPIRQLRRMQTTMGHLEKATRECVWCGLVPLSLVSRSTSLSHATVLPRPHPSHARCRFIHFPSTAVVPHHIIYHAALTAICMLSCMSRTHAHTHARTQTHTHTHTRTHTHTHTHLQLLPPMSPEGDGCVFVANLPRPPSKKIMLTAFVSLAVTSPITWSI